MEAARHPRTPQIVALRFIPGLYWADLVRVGLDMRLHPMVRRAAETRLIDRLPALAVGEKMAIARSASPGVLAALRNDPTPRVIAALLENPRLAEGLLVPLLASESALPAVLAVIAGSPKWSVRYPIRLALCQNPRTPLDRALMLLPMLKRSDLESVAANLAPQAPAAPQGPATCPGRRGTANLTAERRARYPSPSGSRPSGIGMSQPVSEETSKSAEATGRRRAPARLLRVVAAPPA